MQEIKRLYNDKQLFDEVSKFIYQKADEYVTGEYKAKGNTNELNIYSLIDTIFAEMKREANK